MRVVHTLRIAATFTALSIPLDPGAVGASGPASGMSQAPAAPQETDDPFSTVEGMVRGADGGPRPLARVRLRNVTTGDVPRVGICDNRGRFVFEGVEAATYAVEVMADDGRVIALGPLCRITARDRVNTSVRVGPTALALSGFLSNAASQAIVVASRIGVAAMGTNGFPVSPR